MENSQKKNLRVGLFLALGVFTISTSIVLLGGNRSFFAKDVKLFAEMEQTQGLDRGSIVSLSGITIGNISKIEFLPQKQNIVVQLKIQEIYLPRLTKGSRVDVRTQGALGDKYIYIIPGNPNNPPLKEEEFLETEKSMDFLEVLSKKGNQTEKIFDAFDELYYIAKAINSNDRPNRIVSNIFDITENIKSVSWETRKLLSETRNQHLLRLKESLDHLDSILVKLDQGSGTLGSLINDPAIYERLKVILGMDRRQRSIQSLIQSTVEN